MCPTDKDAMAGVIASVPGVGGTAPGRRRGCDNHLRSSTIRCHCTHFENVSDRRSPEHDPPL